MGQSVDMDLASVRPEADIEEQRLRDRLGRLEGALEQIILRGTCWAHDYGQEPCGNCSWCNAKKVLTEKTPTFDWRYRGALYERIHSKPRELIMLKAFAENVDDARLAQILRRDRIPTANEWYTAASLAQWLATPVGSVMLNEAGYQFNEQQFKFKKGI